MNLNKTINYVLILIGCAIAIYAQAEEEQKLRAAGEMLPQVPVGKGPNEFCFLLLSGTAPEQHSKQ